MVEKSCLEPLSLASLDGSGQQYAFRMLSEHVWQLYRSAARAFPWRETDDPYRILLSELMLQQTQTDRVLPKYAEFLNRWPDLRSMAESSLLEVLSAWKGLGYNRRALALRSIAQESERFGWTLPPAPDELIKLPMIGPATCAAIMSFAFHEPAIYLETNIRRVLIHQFHPGEDRVNDATLRAELEALLTLQEDYKGWYYALMDYGVMLKRQVINPNRRSAHYARQGQFEQSNRQLRGLILMRLTEQGPQGIASLAEALPFENERIRECLLVLEKEGFLSIREREPVTYGIRMDS